MCIPYLCEHEFLVRLRVVDSVVCVYITSSYLFAYVYTSIVFARP